MDEQALKVVMNGVKSSCQLVTNVVSQASVLGESLFITFICNLDKHIEFSLSCSVDNSKLGRSDNLVDGRKAL